MNEIVAKNWSILYIILTSQKNSFPLRPQNQEIQDTSSELLIFQPAERKNINSETYFAYKRNFYFECKLEYILPINIPSYRLIKPTFFYWQIFI